MTDIIEVRVNCASQEEAARIAERAVGRRLAASANIHAPITSLYRWQGKIEQAREVPLLLKTRNDLFDVLARLIESLHSYETPGIVALPVTEVNTAYEGWLIAETRPADD